MHFLRVCRPTLLLMNRTTVCQRNVRQVDRQSFRPETAELLVFRGELAGLIENLDSVVAAIGHEHAAGADTSPSPEGRRTPGPVPYLPHVLMNFPSFDSLTIARWYPARHDRRRRRYRRWALRRQDPILKIDTLLLHAAGRRSRCSGRPRLPARTVAQRSLRPRAGRAIAGRYCLGLELIGDAEPHDPRANDRECVAVGRPRHIDDLGIARPDLRSDCAPRHVGVEQVEGVDAQ